MHTHARQGNSAYNSPQVACEWEGHLKTPCCWVYWATRVHDPIPIPSKSVIFPNTILKTPSQLNCAMHTHTYTHMQACTHMHTPSHTHTCKHARTYTNMHVHTNAKHAHTHLRTLSRAHTVTNTHTLNIKYAHIQTHTHMRTCTHTNTHISKHAHKQPHTHMQACTHAHIQSHTHANIHTRAHTSEWTCCLKWGHGTVRHYCICCSRGVTLLTWAYNQTSTHGTHAHTSVHRYQPTHTHPHIHTLPQISISLQRHAMYDANDA